MKAVPKIGLDGLYLGDTIVDDAFAGVVPFYADPPAPPVELFPESNPKEPEEETEPEIAGYIIGIPVPSGLYHPRFDLAAWEAYQEAEESGQQPVFWAEGLTPEEIADMTKPPQPSELDRMGAEIVARELEALELRQQNEILGQQIVQRELEATDLKAQNEALGGQIVGLELRVLTLETTKTEGDTANV